MEMDACVNSDLLTLLLQFWMKFEPDRGNYFFLCYADFFLVHAFADYVVTYLC